MTVFDEDDKILSISKVEDKEYSTKAKDMYK